MMLIRTNILINYIYKTIVRTTVVRIHIDDLYSNNKIRLIKVASLFF